MTLAGARLKASVRFLPLRGMYQRDTCKGCNNGGMGAWRHGSVKAPKVNGSGRNWVSLQMARDGKVGKWSKIANMAAEGRLKMGSSAACPKPPMRQGAEKLGVVCLGWDQRCISICRDGWWSKIRLGGIEDNTGLVRVRARADFTLKRVPTCTTRGPDTYT